jgi:hypothetical protein
VSGTQQQDDGLGGAAADLIGSPDGWEALVRVHGADGGIERVGEVLLQHGIAATGATAGICVVLDDGALHLVGSVGWPEELLTPYERIELDRPLPVAEAVRHQRVVVLTSADEAVGRYPELAPFLDGPQALAAFPILDGDQPVGALALRFDVAVATRLPDASERVDAGRMARALVPALVERVAQLQGALETRVLVEQAKGILAERHGVGIDEAFERLRSAARSRSVRVQEVAAEVIEGRLQL